ncbi:MAG: pitrilysin family protein [Methylophilaceae bacterium]|jgi:zinc protease|nr:pitrilysin family protein [Methylophilaceae bacterium]MDG1454223.1 pitrilysin family protein [Methylophilaceae bacterium]
MKKFQFLIILMTGLVTFSSHAAVKIEHWQTTSGSRVYFVENHDLPILDMSVGFPAGSARNTSETAGLAGVTLHMMSLGAASMNEEEITNAFADIGAEKGGSLDADQASFSLRTLASEKDKALTVFNKILHQPDFPQAVLAREKTRIIAGLQEDETQPESIVNKAFMQALYGKHPYGLPDSGEVNTIEAIKREDLQAFYQQYYSAKSSVIALIGDVTNAEAREIAEKVSAGLPQTAAVGALPKVSLPTAAYKQEISHPASQAHILLGYPGITRGDADYFPLYVGNYILGGGGFVSRLTEEVREKRGLVYSVYSYFIPMAEQGPFQVGLQTKKEQADEALKVVNETLANFMKNGVTAQELQAAKSNITGGFPMRLDSNRDILGYLSMIGFYGLPLTYLDDFNQEVNKLTAVQIKDAFTRRLKVDHFVSVIVGAQ